MAFYVVELLFMSGKCYEILLKFDQDIFLVFNFMKIYNIRTSWVLTSADCADLFETHWGSIALERVDTGYD